jgi:hypothetical protein
MARLIPIYTVRVRRFDESGRLAAEYDERRADCTRCKRSTDPSEIEGNGGLCCSCAMSEADEGDE